jgi:DNA polymerase III gamma/tau subunit
MVPPTASTASTPASTALYRKYRPQNFEEVVGQEAVVRTLRNAIERDQVRQAYLFAGPRGTGKTSLARILAKALNCEQGPTVTPCGQCVSCRTIASGTSLDVVEMDAASQRGIDDIREIRDHVVLQPVQGSNMPAIRGFFAPGVAPGHARGEHNRAHLTRSRSAERSTSR